MTLNLLSDPWIPVVRNGENVVIRPDQIAEPDVSGLVWPRADFNLACCELLIGLLSMADPPKDEADWLARLSRPDAERLREALAPLAAHFALAGDGPRFLQDLEAFERTAKPADIEPVDMLYIDSAGGATASKNADLMVKRDHFASLSPAEAAMALYTLQAFAPTGGRGNRTSMRGGGPLTTLVKPLDDGQFPLWRLVFANVLPGMPLTAEAAVDALPWLRPTRTSEQGQVVTPVDADSREAFFGMSRRLRLVFENGRVVGVVQRPYGTKYTAWEHSLTPYYRQREDDLQWLPRHPKAGRLSYRNWLGVTLKSAGDRKGTRRAAKVVREYGARLRPPDFEIMVGGWAMDNMKPVDFSLDTYPGFPGLDEEGEDRISQLVEAASSAAGALRKALKVACRLDGSSADTAVEAFFAETEMDFEASVHRVIKGVDEEVEEAWHQTLRGQAIRMFDERVLDGLTDHDISWNGGLLPNASCSLRWRSRFARRWTCLWRTGRRIGHDGREEHRRYRCRVVSLDAGRGRRRDEGRTSPAEAMRIARGRARCRSDPRTQQTPRQDQRETGC